MSVFSTWFADELVARGYGRNAENIDKRRVADDLGIVETTVANWLEAKTLPEMRGIVLIAKLLGVPTAEVLDKAGYDINPPATTDERKKRMEEARQKALASIPRFVPVLDKLATKDPARQDTWLPIIEKLMDDNPTN
jgi:transcriptional regulator with XRE-family HTH domain